MVASTKPDRIEWADFSKQVRRKFKTQHAMQKALDFSRSTSNRAWHGKSIGLVPFLRLCRYCGISPLLMLKLDDE